MKYTAEAMVHSSQKIEKVTIIKDDPLDGQNSYIAITSKGTACHAIYNIFTGLYYADDIYAVIKGGADQ